MRSNRIVDSLGKIHQFAVQKGQKAILEKRVIEVDKHAQFPAYRFGH